MFSTGLPSCPLAGCGHSQGIYAPTIRYHGGTFYVITTNVSGGGNFYVTAEDPAGPWSDPVWLGDDAPGIDPSLFFDEDGACYYVGTRPNPEGVRYNGDWEIWVQRLDLEQGRLTGESVKIWKGAMNGVIWPEGPHLYRKDGYYYLMIAEGGTGPDHSVTVARSREIFGPYEGNPDNPILTHRHLGRNYPVTYVGHGDLAEDAAGNWYMVMLASRPQQGYTMMGRETFLARVVWEDGWPVVNPGIGKLEEQVAVPLEESRFEPSLLERQTSDGICDAEEFGGRNVFPGRTAGLASPPAAPGDSAGCGGSFLYRRTSASLLLAGGCASGFYGAAGGRGGRAGAGTERPL